MSAPLLEVTAIDFAYGQVQVLFDVSLSVAPGEALALLGTNGAGKSTLLRVVAGLGVPTRGHVVFDGQDITGRPPHELPGLGLVLVAGGRAIFPDLTVRENLAVGAHLLRRDPAELRRRTDEVLEIFPAVGSRQDTPAGRLSGGEQQQLALAKGLLLQPRLLLVDELSLGLAPAIVETLLEVVRRVHETGTTLVLVEQSLNVAASVCERAVFMEKGAIRFQGRTAELLERDDIARAVFFAERELAR